MTKRKEALEALLEKVEAGQVGPGDFDFSESHWLSDLRPGLCAASYSGDLNAPLHLQGEVLPDWSVDDLSQNGRLAGEPWGIRIAKWDPSIGGAKLQASAGWGSDYLPGDNPARVWFAAILKALIEEEGSRP